MSKPIPNLSGGLVSGNAPHTQISGTTYPSVSTGNVTYPTASGSTVISNGGIIYPAVDVGTPTVPSIAFTEITSSLYYSGGYLGTLKIPSLGVNVKIYEGTDSTQLAKGAGHFVGTSIWRWCVKAAAV